MNCSKIITGSNLKENIVLNTITLSIVVPVYNEEKTIGHLITKLISLSCHKEILIIDDGSTDGTKEVLKRYETEKRISIYSHRHNRGKGEAIKTGIAQATGDYIIIQDADMEQNPEDIKRFFPEIEKGYRAIFGTRVLEWGDDYNIRHTANLFFSFLTNILFRTHLTDIMTGYKMIEANLFRSLALKSNRFGIEPEITIRLIEKGEPIKEIPISYTPRGVAEGKKIKSQDGFSVIAIIIKLFFLIRGKAFRMRFKPCFSKIVHENNHRDRKREKTVF